MGRFSLIEFFSYFTWFVTVAACGTLWFWISSEERTSNKLTGKIVVGLLMFAVVVKTVELALTYL